MTLSVVNSLPDTNSPAFNSTFNNEQARNRYKYLIVTDVLWTSNATSNWHMCSHSQDQFCILMTNSLCKSDPSWQQCETHALTDTSLNDIGLMSTSSSTASSTTPSRHQGYSEGHEMIHNQKSHNILQNWHSKKSNLLNSFSLHESEVCRAERSTTQRCERLAKMK